MQLISRQPLSFLPPANQKTVLELGLQPLPLEQWLVPEDMEVFYPHKKTLWEQRRNQVLVETSKSRQAQAEFSRCLGKHLISVYPERYSHNDDQLSDAAAGLSHPLEPPTLANAMFWVPEDICLLESDGNAYRLTAASVCSPSNWRLEDKLGQTLDGIHGPVPGYEHALAERVNRLFERLTVDKPLLRFNWSIQPGNELAWRDDWPSDAGGELYWRVERQTLRRLPQTGAVVFAIRLFLYSFGQLRENVVFRERLANTLRQLPADQQNYKGLKRLESALAEFVQNE